MAKKAAAKTSTTKSPAAEAKPTGAASKAAAPKAAASKPSATKSPAAKKAAKPVETAAPSVAPKPAAKKTAAKKAAAKPAAAKPATAPPPAPRKSGSPSAEVDTAMAPTPKTTKTTKPAAAPSAVKTPPRVAAAATPAPVAPAPIGPPTLESGVIRPAAKRPAAPTAINASQLYRQERENRLVAQRSPAAPPPAMAELPADYGRTRVSVLVRDAEWLFVYWEISEATRAKLGLQRGRHGEQLILRHYDITGVVDFTGNNANSKFDVFVNDHTSSWYVQVPQSGRRYVVELGILRGSRYTPVSRSTPIEVPLAMIARDIEWAPGSEIDESNIQLLRLSGGGLDLTSRMGSEGFVSELQKRAGFSGSMFSGGLLGSSEFASQALAARREAVGKDRKFWLVVDAEVIVYGATEPDAKVKFMGRPIRLNPDGTFGVRMALPDGTIEFPVEATSADDVETRWVMPVVKRNTEGSTGN